MYSKKVIVTNPQGFHARPASLLVNFCKQYPANITIKYNDKDVLVKSIINVLSAAISGGSEIELCVDGENEEVVCNEVADFISNMSD